MGQTNPLVFAVCMHACGLLFGVVAFIVSSTYADVSIRAWLLLKNDQVFQSFNSVIAVINDDEVWLAALYSKILKERVM